MSPDKLGVCPHFLSISTILVSRYYVSTYAFCGYSSGHCPSSRQYLYIMRETRKITIERGDAVWVALDAKKNLDVAAHLDVRPVIVSHWKRGSLAIEWAVYVKLCEYLGVEVKE